MRFSRNPPLPSVGTTRVTDATTQVALDALRVPLEALLKLLLPFAQPEPWKPLPFNGDWTRTLSTLRAGQYTKDPLGRVELRGWVSTASGASSVIAVLPAGYRPTERCSFDGFRLVGGVYSLARIDVDIDGRVLIASPAMAAALDCSLEGIRFDTR